VDDVAAEIPEAAASVLANLYPVRNKLVRRKGTSPLGTAALSPDQNLNMVQWTKLASGLVAQELLVGVHNTNVVDFYAISPGATITNGAARFTNNDCNSAWINQKIYIGDGYSQNCYIDLETGKAASFASASSQSLSIPTTSSLELTGGSFTLACWVRFSTIGTSPYIIAKSAGGVNTTEYSLSLTNLNAFQFTVGNAGGLGPSGITIGTALTNTWYFVVAWFDSVANTISISLNNGAPAVGTGLNPLIAAGTNAFTLGARSDGANYLNGRIDSVGVWKKVLTAGERTTLYNSGSGVAQAALAGTSLTTSLSGWWDLEEASGSRPDSSSNANTLTSNNGVTNADGVGELVPIVQQAMVGPPLTACVAAADGAGIGNGDYTFKIAFLAANGYLSEASPASNQVTLTAQKADLSSIPVSSEPGVTARYVFAFGGPLDDYFLVDIITNNTATTRTVNLETIINPFSPLQVGNTRFPPCRYLVANQSRMYGAWCATSEGDKSTVYISNYNQPWYSPAAPDLTVSANGTRATLQGLAAGEITGLCPHGDFVVVFTGGAGYWVIGTAAADFRTQLFSNHGCVAHRTIQSVRHLLLWLSADGVYMYDGRAVERISEDVRETIAATSADDMAKAHSFVFYDRYYLMWPGHCLWLDLLTRKWGTNTAWDWRCSTVSTYTSSQQQRLYGAQTGHARAWQLETGTTDNGTAITAEWSSRDWDMGLPAHEKRVHLVEVKWKKATGTAVVTLYNGTGNEIQSEIMDLASTDYATGEIIRMLASANEMARDEHFRLKIVYAGADADYELLDAGLQWTLAL